MIHLQRIFRNSFKCWLTIALCASVLCISSLSVSAQETNSDSETETGAQAGGDEQYNNPIVVPNPGSDLWRAVRGRLQDAPTSYRDLDSSSVKRIINNRPLPAGKSQVKGTDSGLLINPNSAEWLKYRNQMLVPWSAWIFAIILVLIALFAIFRGKLPVEGGLSGKMLFRFGEYERTLHWFQAIVFLFLALTGLILLYGRVALKNLLGLEWFSMLASAAKAGHNLFGPLFLLAVLLMLIRFVRENIYAKGDLTWLLRAGGMFGKGHVTGGFFNMGEKTWYWMLILMGLVVSISGLVLLFPSLGTGIGGSIGENIAQGREIMSLSHIVHTLGAVVLFGTAMGHIYLASIGSVGTLEGMKSGYVDVNWAKSHHDRWAKQCIESDAVISAEEFAARTGKTPAPTDHEETA